MSRIPEEILLKMSSFEIDIHGVKVTGNVADRASVIEKHAPDLIRHLKQHTTTATDQVSSVSSSYPVVGVDVKNTKSGEHVLVIYGRGRCMIIFLTFDLPASLLDFLIRDPKIFFVGVKSLPSVLSPHLDCYGRKYDYWNFSGVKVGIEAGDLVAKHLRKPGLAKSSLADIAQEVDVKYIVAPLSGAEKVLQLDSRNPDVFTDEQLKFAINDARAHYDIGCKVLSSLGL